MRAQKTKTSIIRYKFVCSKMKWVTISKGKHKRKTFCEVSCILRDTDAREQTYKIHSVVEQSNNHFKTSFCVPNRKFQNEQTFHADLLLAVITQFLTVLLADKIHHQYIRSLKPLIAS